MKFIDLELGKNINSLIHNLLLQAKSEVSKLRDEVKKMEEKLKGLESQGNLVCTQSLQ